MNVTYIRYHFILQLKSINISCIFMFVKRWTKIKDNPKQVPRKCLRHQSSCGLYMSNIAEKYLRCSIFTSIWRDCLVGIFTVPWVTASGHSGLKCLKNATEVSWAGKSDLMGHSGAGIKCWFHHFKSSAWVCLFVVVCYVLCRNTRVRSMCRESNRAYQTPEVWYSSHSSTGSMH